MGYLMEESHINEDSCLLCGGQMHFLPAWGTVQLILCPILCSGSYHTDPMWVSFGKNDSKPKKGKKKKKEN